VFSSNEDWDRLSSSLAISMNAGKYCFCYKIRISDCDGFVSLYDGDIESKEGFKDMLFRFRLFRDEFTKACEHLESEMKRLEIEL